ncbi:hypothetical protein C1922_02335 [Stenotrophomonas sp. ZAC14D2_NAIMI4_7]|uniref:DUF1629 domain-containing protein n=1 Tax=Stenotrophomonas TaxID=40323 RepID=UPI000D53D7E7|nr:MULTISPECIES: DUF1629 domain-containing protein [Stenotrophomonas]AWH16246.1 hypothetical protein C1922_02335 [Stenotrophomonas sp. ZAC14D2_NAIMI4_7]
MTSNVPKKGEYFELRPDARRRGKGHGVIFVNESELKTPPHFLLRPDSGGFPALREVPRLVYYEKEGWPPQDLEAGMSGYWLVSARLRHVMETVDPAAFAFNETDYRFADGASGDSYFLCDVVRTLDALDEESSQLKIIVSDDYEEGKYYGLTGDVRLAFKREVIGDAHVFRLPYYEGVFCDRVFKEAVEAAGIVTKSSSNGLWFYDAVNC